MVSDSRLQNLVRFPHHLETLFTPLTLFNFSFTPGTSRYNEPLQAVIENKLHESALSETNNSILERNRALLQYIATIANSNSNTDEFNYEFVESLVKGGAEINIGDQYGQTIFHEVARSWNVDVARFLLELGKFDQTAVRSSVFRCICVPMTIVSGKTFLSFRIIHLRSSQVQLRKVKFFGIWLGLFIDHSDNKVYDVSKSARYYVR